MSASKVAQSVAGAREGSPGNAQQPGATAITIGNFDGVHRGHAALVQAARAAVGERGRVVVMAFDPNPLSVLRPESKPLRLSTFAQRERWLMELGVDEVVRIEPTPQFLQQDAQAFVNALVERHRPTHIVEGADFRFGRARGGSIETLRELEGQFGYRTIVVDAVDVALDDQSLVRASSSLARWLVTHGRVRDAMRVLGRAFEIEAEVVQGDQRGRDIGFPTANLKHEDDQVLPADGIYAGVAVRDGSREYLAAISVGTKPTFGQHPRVCEAFLLDYDGPVNNYGWTIRLQFTHWLRDQLKYESVEALIEQLHRDVADVRRRAKESPGIPIPGPRAMTSP